MAYLILVALLLSSVTGQQEPRDAPHNGPKEGPAAGPPPFGSQPWMAGFWPRPTDDDRPRPGPTEPRPGLVAPRPGPWPVEPSPGPLGPRPRPVKPRPGSGVGNIPKQNPSAQPWNSIGPLKPEGEEDQNNEVWPNGNDQFEESSEFPNRGDKRGFASRPQQSGIWSNSRNPNNGWPQDAHRPFTVAKPLSFNKKPYWKFTPLVKVDDMTLPNTTVPLKEGENIFLLPWAPQAPQRAPEELRYGVQSSGLQPYLKLIYNPTATQRISFEYGFIQLLPPSFLRV